MRLKTTKCFAVLSLILTSLVFCSVTTAAVINIKFTSTIGWAPYENVDIGETVSLVLTLDNGNTSLINQTWTIDDLSLASLTVGDYWSKFSDSWYQPGTETIFTTNAAGELSYSRFLGVNTSPISPTHEDIIGTNAFINSNGQQGSIYLYETGFRNHYGYTATWLASTANNSNWSFGNSTPEPSANTSVPEPSTLAIFALGVIGLASRRFKKQA